MNEAAINTKKGGILVTEVPSKKFLKFWTSKKDILVFTSGRGAGKSETIAQLLVLEAVRRPIRVLCVRDLAVTTRDSIKAALEAKIDQMGLERYFHITQLGIKGRGPAHGSMFMFKGVGLRPMAIKSFQDLNYVVVEESQEISRPALDQLLPTARLPGVRVIFMINPEREDDPVYEDFIAKKVYDDITEVIHCSFLENRFCPPFLMKLYERDKAGRSKAYVDWRWHGAPNNSSDARVFLPYSYENGKEYGIYGKGNLDSFVNGHKPMFGMDWGLVRSPTTLMKIYELEVPANELPDAMGAGGHGNLRVLYVAREAYEYGITIRSVVEFAKRIPQAVGEGYPVMSDVQWDASDDFIHEAGLNTVAAFKPAGAIDDGVRRMSSYDRIVIHPSCEMLLEEMRLYRLELDKRTNTVKNGVYEDKHNDCIDAIRYALQGKYMSQQEEEPEFDRSRSSQWN